jgi:transcription initiation factor IIF auxiliary subunit
MCRAPFAEDYIPDIDKEFQEFVANSKPEEFKSASNVLKENGMWRGNLQSIKFFFGNKHRHLSVQEAGEDAHNTHEWTGFVECANPDLTKKFISKVEFKLHPTFHPPKVTVTKLPLEIKRWGWGVFEIKIIIHWKKWVKRDPTKYTHMLSFDGEGKRNAFLIDIQKEDFEKMP